jgi:DNA-binding NtrC family response regulator
MVDYEILFVDDDEVILDMVGRYLQREGYQVSLVNSGLGALELLQKKNFDVVFTDFKMPEIDGLELLSAIKQYRPNTEVIVVTGHGTMETAVQAMKIGSYDYLQKPFKLDLLKLLIDRILEEKRLKDENVRLKARLKERHRYGRIYGISLKMREIYETIEQMQNQSPNVLIQGESGVGKQLVAREIHATSDRSHRSFSPVGWRAFQKETNADEIDRKVDKLLADNQGATLYLDEVTDIPPQIQNRLLRKLGSAETDVRIIAASARDLRDAIESQQMHQDFLSLVDGVVIQVPPLRNRKEDICLLVNHFLFENNAAAEKKIYGIDPEAVDNLLRYHWPGNVIQLENVIERAFALGVENVIRVTDLPAEIRTFAEISRHV